MLQKTRKYFIILALLMFIFMPFSFADNGDYTIPEANVDITVCDNGSCIITESVTQDIEGSVNGVFRKINLKENQDITDISVETPGLYNKVDVIREGNNLTMKVWLYKDAAMTQKISSQKVRVIYHYTFNKVIKIHNDIAELQYLTWPDQWDSRVDKLNTSIHLPGQFDGLEYWYNPPTYLLTSKINDNTLNSYFENVPANTYVEQRILIPKEYFKSYDNAVITNVDAVEKIRSDEEKYLNDLEFNEKFGFVLNVVLTLLGIIPTVLIYLIYGKEPKVDYNQEYESDVPSDESYLFVNNVYVSDVGEFDTNAFSACLLDLIDRGYYKVVFANDDDTIIRSTSKDMSSLKEYEKMIITYFKRYENQNQEISFKEIGKNKEIYAEDYKNFLINWKASAQNEISQKRVDSLFIDKGGHILTIFSAALLAVSAILMILNLTDIFTMINFYLIMAILFFAIILMSLPNTWAGRWTEEGLLLNKKWNAFKKYLCDYSLIKERPPASIQVWGKYLVYATALGCAKQTSDTMRKYFESINIDTYHMDNSDIVLFAYYGGLSSMNNSLTSLSTYSDDSSSIGSIGGGSGGGGGGTF